MLLVTRLLAGFGASAIYALGGVILGDLWRPDQRGRSLGLYMLIPLLGAAVGPIHGGVYGRGDNFEVDILVNLNLTSRHDHWLSSVILRGLCTYHSSEESRTSQEVHR